LEVTGFSRIAVFLPHESELSSVIATDEDFEMKAFVAACIATAILWGADVKLNDGRYSAVVQNVVVGALPK
jgi:hypothetical protein